ncbi:MAG: hypothetical protein AAB263_04015, partial [Planctomycetota bacterium]
TATHTHSGPSTHRTAYPRGSKEAAYGKKLRRILSDLVVKADATAAPGTFETATINAPKWGSNRRIKQADGTWTNEWRDPKRRHPGYFDPSILLVGVRRPNGRLDALLVNYGSHPVTFGPQNLAISGDYPSYLKAELEKKKAARTAIFGISGHANINPPECIHKSPRYARTMGKALAKLIVKALPRLKPLHSGPVASALVPWKLRLAQERPHGKGMNWESRDGFIRTQIMGLRAGDFSVVSIPGELFSEYVQYFRANSPFPATMVLSLGNDYAGYFPTDQAQREGAYEARMAPGRLMEKTLKRLAITALKRCGKPAPARKPTRARRPARAGKLKAAAA